MDFYKNALKSFKMVILDDGFDGLKDDAQDYYNINYVIPQIMAYKRCMKWRQKEAEEKKKRVVERYEDDQWDSWVSRASI